MESSDSGVTSPALRVTAEITEIRDKNESVSPPSLSKERRYNSALSTKKKYLKPLYGCNPYERSNYGGSYVSSQQNPKNNVSSFTQRIMSAKLLRMKQLQNQLYETQTKLNEALQENRTLITVQKRQDYVLKKYEGNQEQLPQLMRSHHEEIRILKEKYKQLRSSHRELENRLKQKDNELTSLREQHKHLLKLSKDKQLGEREKLTKKVEEMQAMIEDQRKKILTLTKKLDIEEKSYHHQLSQEMAKQKKLQIELNSALEAINNLKAASEVKERKSVVSFQKPIPNSEKYPQVPLRVSIRQPKQQAAVDQESDTDDSFTMNYSPVAHRNSSLESESSLSETEPIDKQNRKLSTNTSSTKILNSTLKNGFKISQNPQPITTHTVLNHVLDVSRIEKIQKPEESKVRRKLHEQKTFQKTPIIVQAPRRPSLNKVVKNLKKINVNKSGDDEKSKSKSIPIEEGIKNEIKNPLPSNLTENTHSEIKNEKFETDMKLDIDSEFEKLFESTQISDASLNAFYRKDFTAEIDDLEKKFQELHEQNNEKMQAACRFANKVSTDNGESEEISTPEVLQLEGMKGTNEVQNSSDGLPLQETRITIPLLESTQKADLLKALNSIDVDADKDGLRPDTLDLLQMSNTSLSTSETSCADKVNELKMSFSRTRRKSKVLKDLFGSDDAVLKS